MFLAGQLSNVQLDVFSIKTAERGVCCACSSAICKDHMPCNLLHRIGKRDVARNKGEQYMRAFVRCKGADLWLSYVGGIGLSVLASADRLFVCSECADDFDR